MRAREGKPTVPSTMGLEKKTNPFLRPDSGGNPQELGHGRAPATVAVFGEIRARRIISSAISSCRRTVAAAERRGDDIGRSTLAAVPTTMRAGADTAVQPDIDRRRRRKGQGRQAITGEADDEARMTDPL